MHQMTEEQIEDIAKGVARMRDAIEAFYADPANRRAFEAWYRERYGKEWIWR